MYAENCTVSFFVFCETMETKELKTNTRKRKLTIVLKKIPFEMSSI